MIKLSLGALLFALIFVVGTYLPAVIWLRELIPDKIQHASAYGALALLILSGLRTLSVRYAVGWAWLAVALLGALDEFHQTFIPGRNGDVLDWVADVGAAALVCLLYWLSSLPIRSRLETVWTRIQSTKNPPARR